MMLFNAFFENPTNIHFATQENGEKIVFVLRAAFITNFKWIFIAIVGFLLPIFYMNAVSRGVVAITPFELENALILFWYILLSIYTIEKYIEWYFNVYIVTDRRVVDVDFTPLFSKKISETTYDKIEDTSFTMHNVLQTVFNFGDVFLQTAAEKREFDFKNVPNPARVQDILSDLAAKFKNK